MKYNCIGCNYSTNDSSNYNRHMKSSAHVQLKQEKLPTCIGCNKTFSSAPSLSRHKNHFCKNNDDNILLKTQLNEQQLLVRNKNLEIENNLLQQQLKNIKLIVGP